ncbi:hypothetical protein BDB00DRAFT_836339 [Zychaea mexicana]|uniref:uncharacterized protein n=1 Tax=Zychaea mexicana TaxID=64656 RepID=UPI0022FEA7DD|nr:uncharacterized protein BDB00DRAFT_851114 [Zychaea mexicana]XP_052976954.1 uncharacterized protein BDB00DRAFT_836339 [Zychaea mexicana]KAI9487939.1 hypothetical protein BDB00DRAFT_851114 [Zychaea mexicana]KAI9490689.1 hypothetical protein BDB00DRAFT_836339 [Zychaea mexicana]
MSCLATYLCDVIPWQLKLNKRVASEEGGDWKLRNAFLNFCFFFVAQQPIIAQSTHRNSFSMNFFLLE